jgi:hypothetical protein
MMAGHDLNKNGGTPYLDRGIFAVMIAASGTAA